MTVKKIDLPRPVASELGDFSRRSGRSTGFLVRRILAAAQKMHITPEKVSDPAKLDLKLDDEDDPRTLARVGELLAARGGDPGGVVAASWAATKGQFLAWLARQEEADQAAKSDDLDAALAEASSESAPADRLLLLASHEYVQVRTRVAGNPRAPLAAFEKLVQENEKVILDRLAENPSLPVPLRARVDEKR
jgi:hypothetical protein